ncbi:toxin YoeB [Flavobacterium flevense]|uniref:Putative mRNA interferase YoeB n=1 Tax=Flavobacterium flevense TaxID=983 RepID=A0A4Y4ATP3_9FLAO|nr:Txe/YoeB family addiction module toxin [Flavobacterium flevense]GEC71575.1 Txe/YoeB family addiction module toxin [Flavobacterium flevense]SHL49514.1 toxin YoeB [Flavobacterium flevense]
MQIDFSDKAKADLNFWIKSGNKGMLKKIYSLIEDIQLHPFEGLGKPEELKHQLSGRWSRRINKEHRIIYRVTEENKIEILNILSLKGHY